MNSKIYVAYLWHLHFFRAGSFVKWNLIDPLVIIFIPHNTCLLSRSWSCCRFHGSDAWGKSDNRCWVKDELELSKLGIEFKCPIIIPQKIVSAQNFHKTFHFGSRLCAHANRHVPSVVAQALSHVCREGIIAHIWIRDLCLLFSCSDDFRIKAPVPLVRTETNVRSPRKSIRKPVSSARLTFENITYTVQLKKKKSKKILDGISGSIESGKFTAIMGASGAGKVNQFHEYLYLEWHSQVFWYLTISFFFLQDNFTKHLSRPSSPNRKVQVI